MKSGTLAAIACAISVSGSVCVAGDGYSGVRQESSRGGSIQIGDGDPVVRNRASQDGGGGSGNFGFGPIGAAFRSVNTFFGFNAPNTISGDFSSSVSVLEDSSERVDASAYGYAESWFTVTEDVMMSLTGQGGTSSTWGDDTFHGAAVLVTLRRNATNLFRFELGADNRGVESFSRDQVLGQGNYFITVDVISSVSGESIVAGEATAFADFELVLTPVPSPGSLAILPLAGLLTMRRRR